ncbi:MAG: IS66 family transposase [Simkaniaceae bacterium]|nr:MAG: IS66 family transposase [Simkaniaceae bacterium]QVL55361.1 MAG: IS66 family transposase [Simkaniaceae bacterium]
MTALESPSNTSSEIDQLKAELAELRSIIFELKDENERLKKKVKELEKENVLLRKENAQLRAENAALKEENQWLKKQIFGKRSERLITGEGQLEFPGMDLPNEEYEEKEIKGHTRRKQRSSTEEDKITFPEDLLKETIILDLAETEKVCPQTGEALEKIGEEVTQKLAFKPGSFFIKEFIKPKYVSKKAPELGVMSAPTPEGIFLKSKADESLLAHVITMKFGDHLPLYRIQEILERDGIKISRQTLSHWVLHVGENLIPLYEAMKKHILSHPSIFVDESPIGLLVKGKKKVHQSYMWVYVGGKGLDPPYRLFEFCLNRSYHHPLKMLEGYEGRLHSDKYGAYEELAKKEKVTWCPCWAHIRRYFLEAKGGDQEFCSYVLRKIRYLYMLERVAKSRSNTERLKIRKEKEEPIINDLIDRVKNKLIKGKHLPKSKYQKALVYFSRLIPYLKNYLSDPEAQIDNNVAERAIRPLAIGRKNWLFVGSEKGGKATATLLSLVQTCRNLKINPREYLDDILRRVMSHPSSKIEELLPDQWERV